MGTRFIIWKIYIRAYHEILFYTCNILYLFQPIVKPVVYWEIITYIIILCITTSTVKTKNKNDLNRYWRIQGFSSSKMILSAYMFSKEYTGFLQKLGKLPKCVLEKLHQFGVNAIFLMELMCSKSINKFTYRLGRFPRYSLMIFSLVELTCAPSTSTANTLTNDVLMQSHRNNPENKCTQQKCVLNKKCLQDVPLDDFFIPDLSNMAESNNIDFSLPVLEVHDDNSSTSDTSTSSMKATTDNITNGNTPNAQFFLNEDDNLVSYEYCLMVDTEVLSLVNSAENKKPGKR